MHISTQLERLAKLLVRLDAGDEVSLRDMKSLLPKPIYEQFGAAREELKSSKKNARSHPKQLTAYNVVLRTADLLKGRLRSLKKVDEDKLRDAYVGALDILRDWQRREHDIEHWFDRPLDWDHIKPTHDGVPRCRYLRRDAAELKTIKSLKREYLLLGKTYIEQHHADELPKPITEEQALELKRRLAAMKQWGR